MSGIFSAISKAIGLAGDVQEDLNTPEMKKAKRARLAARRKDEIEKAAEDEDTEFFKEGLGE